ncbi:MAG: hypothetical protein LBD55_11035 [Treponema sp.]|jgi:hypothetical protein|nr:hypothetical protein [Treponema sp.]
MVADFFQSLFFLLFKSDDPAFKSKMALRQVGKEIKYNKYHKFYRVKTGEIRSGMGAFFFDIYRVIFPIRAYISHADKSAVLKQIIIETCMGSELRDLYNRLTPESIEKRSKSLNFTDLSNTLQEEMETLSSSLHKDFKIDRYYTLIAAFTRFVRFDFFSILKKIDPQFQDGSLMSQPCYRSIPGQCLVEYIKDFLELSAPDARHEEWRELFDILKKYKAKIGEFDQNQWKKLLGNLQDVLRSDILVLTVRHIEQNPDWQHNIPRFNSEDIVEGLMKTKRAEVNACIDKIKRNNRIAEREALAARLFGNSKVTGLQYYTAVRNEVFTQKNLDGFTYIPELNYMMIFFGEYQDIQELCNLFVIRGQWASRQASQGLHELTDVLEKLKSFDASLAENETNGSKLKTYSNKSNLERDQFIKLRAALGSINNQAKELITQGIRGFTTVRSCLKDLSGDCANNQSVILLNWEEIASLSERPIVQRIEQACTVTGDFLTLLRLFVSEET